MAWLQADGSDGNPHQLLHASVPALVFAKQYQPQTYFANGFEALT
jgi:hypothetical protein